MSAALGVMFNTLSPVSSVILEQVVTCSQTPHPVSSCSEFPKRATYYVVIAPNVNYFIVTLVLSLLSKFNSFFFLLLTESYLRLSSQLVVAC